MATRQGSLPWLVTGLFAVALVGPSAMGQPEDEDTGVPTGDRAVVPSAVSSLNADKVDGRHAVGAGATKKKRANKLVATNKYGVLPSNIVKPYWGSIRNKPAGFADGKDNVGVKRFYQRTQVFEVSEATTMGRSVKCDAGDFATGGSAYVSFYQNSVVLKSDEPWDGGRGWSASTRRDGSEEANLTIWVVCADMG